MAIMTTRKSLKVIIELDENEVRELIEVLRPHHNETALFVRENLEDAMEAI